MQKRLLNKDYVLMLQGNAVSAVGDLLYSVAIGYWVYEQTGSSALMGVMSSIAMFTFMLLAPFAGTIVDKCNRKVIIVRMDVLRGVVMLLIGALAYTNKLSVPWVLVTALIAALSTVFFSPAVSTLMLDIIPHDDMVRGQSIHSGITSVINLVGKAFSGVLVAFLGVPLVIVINGISYLISALTEAFIHVPKSVQQGQKVTVKGVVKDFGIAIRTVFSNPALKLFVPCVLILNLLASGPSSLMLPFCMEKGFTVDMYGYLLSVQTAASLLCVTLFGIIKFSPVWRYRIMSFSFCISCVTFVLMFASNLFVPMSIFAFISSLLNAAGNTVFNAALMLALPNENRGAVLGFIQAASTGGSALSAMLFGLLGEAFPLALVFIAGNLITIIPMLYLCFHPLTKRFILSH